MIATVSGSSWRTVVVRLGLLALFPAGLLLLRFLHPHELADIRRLVASLRRSGEPVATTP
jgi:hypothetical protein